MGFDFPKQARFPRQRYLRIKGGVTTGLWASAVLSRLGFKQEATLLGGLVALVTKVWGPSGRDPTCWCPTLAMNLARIFGRNFSYQVGGDPTSGNLGFCKFSRTGGCWFLTFPKQAGCRQ